MWTNGDSGAGLAGRLQQVQGADGVGVEVVEGNGRGPVVGRLGGGVDDARRAQFRDQGEHAAAVADVEFVVDEVRQLSGEPVLVPAGVPLRAEEDGALVVVDAVDLPTEGMKEGRDLRADQAGGAGDENLFRHGWGPLKAFESVLRVRR